MRMAHCIVVCGCDNVETVTKADLDRFTDTIENVLNHEKGRKHFRNFMLHSKMKDGKLALDVWEHIAILLKNNMDPTDKLSPSFLSDVDKLINNAERIEELDSAAMELLYEARNSENYGAILKQLKTIRMEATLILCKKYSKFRHHFIPIE